jgi:hypothetical protein
VADRQALADDLDHHRDHPALNDQIGVGALAKHGTGLAVYGDDRNGSI